MVTTNIINKLKSEDWETRVKTISEIQDGLLLINIALNDENQTVRATAIAKMFDENLLINNNTIDGDVRAGLVNNLNDPDFLKDIILNDEDASVRVAAAWRDVGDNVLREVVLNDEDEYVRKVAAMNIEDENVISDVFSNVSDMNVSSATVNHLSNQNNFEEMINNKTSRKRKVSSKIRQQVLERDNYTCQMCGRTRFDGVKLEVDHIIPVAKGGSDNISNLQTLCRECNRGKSAKILPNQDR